MTAYIFYVRDSTSAGGGKGKGKGKGSKEKKTDDEKSYEKLIKNIKDTTNSLNDENDALMLVASGRTKNVETAQLMIEAARLTGGAVDATTLSLIKQKEEAEKLNEKLKILAADPLKEWLDGVPSWIEAGQQIETEVFQSLSDSISDMMQKGTMDWESLGDAMVGIFADVIADKATKEFLNLMGMGGEETAKKPGSTSVESWADCSSRRAMRSWTHR
ncbi:hypothetical protein M3484_22485 [Pseudomonas sp. GX19020]|uniref:phage tail tape measure C-terminal domain-containing protein n=1 Tax=Pseudomonas sp. GX19020 TaxID=2942277 RepID=UPI0020197973|nr:phage tail tape measure C-terminal domain-containing protein [Pseudomonas sp. GX19020]MCL4069330.1 hypothetical protein [Pseudomonas sp. GX19020]